RALEHAASGREAEGLFRGEDAEGKAGGPGRRGERLREDLRRPDPSLRAARSPLPRARHRRLRPLRLAPEAAPLLRGQSLLRDDRGAEGARRPGRRQGQGRGGRDQEIRHRSRESGPDHRMSQVLVPDIGDFKEVEVIEILVKPGDAVTKEQSLITLESDKATMEIPSPSDGVVQSIKLKVGDKVSKGAAILELDAKEKAKAAEKPKPAEKTEKSEKSGSDAITVPVPDIGDFKEV